MFSDLRVAHLQVLLESCCVRNPSASHLGRAAGCGGRVRRSPHPSTSSSYSVVDDCRSCHNHSTLPQSPPRQETSASRPLHTLDTRYLRLGRPPKILCQ